MQFKVGDRVEVLRPAEGTISTEANNIGLGTVERLGSDSSIKVKVDTNESAWWYERGDVRLAVKEIGIHPTPSITVGTQVRLTGVVEPDPAEGGGGIYLRTAGGHSVYLNSSAKEDLEVIRQPFKRGEVVRHKTVMADDCVVIEDEANGRVLLVVAREGVTTFEMDAEDYKLVSK